ncbi:MAG: SDR family NAD(P)-dependent oxidoreductase [Lachnospiraceae bacterium]|nr:SDR family NAD(P)-dependent oxidoreductase [Lachnospiraceae bacterium]
MNIAIITGASSGMGKEFAVQLDQRLGKTDEIWLLARSREPLEKLADSLRTKTRVIVVDLTDGNALKQFEEVLAIQNPKITVLVNCAGVGSHKLFARQDKAEIDAMIELNITALTRMTMLCLPYMKRGSKLIQVSSGAAFVPQSAFAVYAASKAYVYSLSRALGQELEGQGITVTAVCPGPVNTPFLARAYEDMSGFGALKKLTMAKTACVVKKALDDCRMGKSVSICGLPVKLLYLSTQSVQNMMMKCLRGASKARRSSH